MKYRVTLQRHVVTEKVVEVEASTAMEAYDALAKKDAKFRVFKVEEQK